MGVESAWGYPRPPRLEPSGELVEVVLGGHVVARTTAPYLDLVAPGRTATRAARTYPAPSPGYEAIVGRVGWITARVIGPFKGEPGTAGW